MEKKFEVQVNSVEEYVQQVFSLSRNLIVNAEKQEELLFRGQDNKEYQLLPAIARESFKLEQERNLIEMAKYKLPETFSTGMSPLDLLAMLQHYGIPTRLLDVTSNPLVALFFACESSKPLKEDEEADEEADEKVDGEVIVFKNNASDIHNYPLIYALADSYRLLSSRDTKLEIFFQKIKTKPYFEEQKVSIEDRGIEWDESWIEECCKKLIFVRSQERSLRQKLQQAQFILFPNKISDRIVENGKRSVYFEGVIEPIPKSKDYTEKSIIISRYAKRQIKKDLKALGISKATLFADSIDTVCKEIAESYKHKYQQKYYG